MPLFPTVNKDAIYLAMDDPDELLSRTSNHAFKLDDQEWQTVEHYFQSMKYDGTAYAEKIRAANSPEQARKLGKAFLRKKRPDLKAVKTTIMTRALYTKVKTHADVQTRLLDTGESELVENSQFDYYWGCGRDHRGENHYGKVLMNVRQKLREESGQ